MEIPFLLPSMLPAIPAFVQSMVTNYSTRQTLGNGFDALNLDRDTASA